VAGAQILQVRASGGRLVRVLRTQTARYSDEPEWNILNSASQVLSLDETGQYALVQTIQFGWLRVGGPDPGRFTPLPGFPPGQEAFWAAW
jgi:hypothetical protein